LHWKKYRQIIQDKVNLSTELKEHEDLEIETNNILNLLQRAAKEATPNNDSQRTTNFISYEFKKLVSEKRRASSIRQRTHTPSSRRIYNRTSKKLKSKLQEMRNESFKKYVSILKREDNAVWIPIKNRRKPKTTTPPVRKYSKLPGPWAKKDKENPNYLKNIFPNFFLHIMIKTRKWNKT